MSFNYEEKKQLIQLAKFMREGNKLYPTQCFGVLFTSIEGEACALGCVLSIIDPMARKKYLEDVNKPWKILMEAFPILEKESPNGDMFRHYIWSLNDLKLLSVLEIADKVEELAYDG
jgi:hypothetical protein